MSTEGDRLRTEQAGLARLAADVRSLLDATATLAEDRAAGDSRWSGPQADRVRGELSVWKGRARTVADTLDTEAAQRGKDAVKADKAPGG
ncbi:hypothetical protein OG900_32385 [Streptomyces sp. NBC_00433]